MSFVVALIFTFAGMLYAQDMPQTPPEVLPNAPPQGPPETSPETSQEAAQEPQLPVAPDEADLLRIREQLDRLLGDAGLPVGDERETTASRIEALAQRSGELSKQAASPRTKLEASNLELRSYNALAQDAYLKKDVDQATLRSRQMRTAAEEAKTIPEPAAKTVGDFWLLQADLLQLNNDVADANERQERAIALLEKFDAARREAGDAVEHDDAARQITTDVRLSLLRLYDDRGDSAKACAMVNHLRAQAQATDNAALREQIDKWYGYCDVLGQRFDATLPTPRSGPGGVSGTWSTTAALGKPVLLHIWASWWPASHDSLAKLKAIEPTLKDKGVELVSIDLGQPAKTSRRGASVAQLSAQRELTWVQCTQPTGVMDLQALFRIRSLPRYVLLDEQGRVKAISGSLAIVEQLATKEDADVAAPPGDVEAPPAP